MSKWIDKFYEIVDKIGKHNFILIAFVVIVLMVTGLYSTFSLYTSIDGVNFVDGLTTYKFILDSTLTDTSVIVPAKSSKNFDIVISNPDELALKYGLYYNSSSDLTSVIIGYTSSTLYPTTGVIGVGDEYTITLKVTNKSYSDVTINFGISSGFENGGDLNLPNGSSWINLHEEDVRNIFIEDILKNNAILDSSINFSVPSSSSGTNGIYKRSGTENNLFPIYYYRGNVNNNLIFADICWKVVRTTDTGGVKLIYNGLPIDGTCNNTGVNSQISIKNFNKSDISQESLAYVGYMYSEPYISGEKNMIGDSSSYIYGSDVVYANGKYTLVDTITSSDWAALDAGGLSNYHYTCFEEGVTECSQVKYIYNTYNYTESNLAYAWYIELNDGKKIEDAIDVMLGNDNGDISKYNKISSTIKGNTVTEGTIDYWYYFNIEQKGYGNYIEDTVWCNDRNVFSSSLGGFDPNGGLTDVNANNVINSGFIFSVYGRSSQSIPSLECSREIDKFTVSKVSGNGNLTYPVGLLTADEITLAGGSFQVENTNYYLYTGQDFWTMSASAFYKYNAYLTFISANGSINFNFSNSAMGVRPSISLKAGFSMKDGGDGSATNPYVVNY